MFSGELYFDLRFIYSTADGHVAGFQFSPMASDAPVLPVRGSGSPRVPLWVYQHGITRAWLWEPACASAGVSAWYHSCVVL